MFPSIAAKEKNRQRSTLTINDFLNFLCPALRVMLFPLLCIPAMVLDFFLSLFVQFSFTPVNLILLQKVDHLFQPVDVLLQPPIFCRDRVAHGAIASALVPAIAGGWFHGCSRSYFVLRGNFFGFQLGRLSEIPMGWYML